MKTTLLFFLKKPKTKSKYEKKIDDFVYDALADEVASGHVILGENKRIVVDAGKHNAELWYSVSQMKNMIIFDLYTNDTNQCSFQASELVLNCFSKTEVRKDFNIAKVYDEPSQLLCEWLYNPLTVFERSLRKLIYEIVVKFYGSEWYKKTVQIFMSVCDKFNELNDQVRMKANQNHVDYIESALEQMTYGDLIAYLFEKKTSMPYQELVENDLSSDNLKHMTKIEIVHRINSSRAKSLWEKLFNKYTELENLEKDMSRIQLLRNTVMHAKSITYEEYISCSELLKKWNALLEKTITENEKEEYSTSQNVVITESLNELLSYYKATLEPIYNVINSTFLNNFYDYIREQVTKHKELTESLMPNNEIIKSLNGLLSLNGLSLPQPSTESTLWGECEESNKETEDGKNLNNLNNAVSDDKEDIKNVDEDESSQKNEDDIDNTNTIVEYD